MPPTPGRRLRDRGARASVPGAGLQLVKDGERSSPQRAGSGGMGEWYGALMAWSRALRAAGRRPATVRLYQHYIEVLAARLGPDPWAVTRDDLEQLLGSVEWGPSARKSMRTAVGGFYRWAHETGRVAEDPAANLPTVRVPRGQPRPTPEGIFIAALEAADGREWLMLALAGLIGLRAGEISRVHVDDLLDDVLLVHGKGGKDRRVPVTYPEIVEAIASADGWVFPNVQRGGHLTPNHVSKILSGLLPGKWTGHTLRHRFGTRSFAGSRDLLAVSALLGHASTETTLIYVQLPDDHLRDAVRAAAPLRRVV